MKLYKMVKQWVDEKKKLLLENIKIRRIKKKSKKMND